MHTCYTPAYRLFFFTHIINQTFHPHIHTILRLTSKERKKYTNCNSRWSQNEGASVWCEDKMIPEAKYSVVPRQINDIAGARCVCVENGDFDPKIKLRQFKDCDAGASKCVNAGGRVVEV